MTAVLFTKNASHSVGKARTVSVNFPTAVVNTLAVVFLKKEIKMQ